MKDRNGVELKPGDLVTITCRIEILDNGTPINVIARTVEKAPPYGYDTAILLNSAQVEFAGRTGCTGPLQRV